MRPRRDHAGVRRRDPIVVTADDRDLVDPGGRRRRSLSWSATLTARAVTAAATSDAAGRRPRTHVTQTPPIRWSLTGTTRCRRCRRSSRRWRCRRAIPNPVLPPQAGADAWCRRCRRSRRRRRCRRRLRIRCCRRSRSRCWCRRCRSRRRRQQEPQAIPNPVLPPQQEPMLVPPLPQPQTPIAGAAGDSGSGAAAAAGADAGAAAADSRRLPHAGAAGDADAGGGAAGRSRCWCRRLQATAHGGHHGVRPHRRHERRDHGRARRGRRRQSSRPVSRRR